MKYQNGSFSVPVGGKAYADGWERTFGKKAVEMLDVQLCRCGRKLTALMMTSITVCVACQEPSAACNCSPS